MEDKPYGYGGVFYAKGHKSWAAFMPWKDKAFQTYLSFDGTKLDTEEKAQATLDQMNNKRNKGCLTQNHGEKDIGRQEAGRKKD